MSIADGTSVIPPGWYPDPADAARLRRWDGQQWTQEVLLAPEQAPAAASFPTEPPVAQQPYVPPVAPEPQPATSAAPQQPAAPQQSAAPQGTVQPPLGKPVPASPAPSAAPPGPPMPPVSPQASQPPTVPRPSPSVSQPPNPPPGPVSLPEWATLPGLTLPPDLSSLPGMESNSILKSPTFVEPEPQRELPTLPVFEPPFIPQRPDVEEVRRPKAETPAAGQVAPAPPTAPYAPPPSGAQYDVPPPPGMAHVPNSTPVLPPSAFVAPQVPATTWPQLPPVGSAPIASAPVGPAEVSVLPRTIAATSYEPATGTGTVSSWLIAALPLLQFAVIYVVFGVLGVTLAPGMQWGILAAPAAFSLLFANADRKRLAELGVPSPSIVLAFIPPLYLVVRIFTAGRSSVLPLVAWVVLQAGAAAGVYFLLRSVLGAAIRAIGL